MLVLLLSIFEQRRADYRTRQTHSCRRLPPLGREGTGLSDRHNDQPSHSISTELSFVFESQPLIQSAAPGCPRSRGLEEGWATGRPWLQGFLLLWQH